jgi:hypothetical protein
VKADSHFVCDTVVLISVVANKINSCGPQGRDLNSRVGGVFAVECSPAPQPSL